MAAPAPVTVEVFPDPESVARRTAKLVLERFRAAVESDGRFRLVLSGGGTPVPTYRRLAESPCREEIDWTAVDVFFGDERSVGPEEEGSNYRMAREAFLSQVPIPAGNVHRICGELPSEDAARGYEELIRAHSGTPPHFDLVFLGMGGDGHTASLFPGSAALEEEARLVVEAAGPPPYPSRVTLTRPAFALAREIVFLVTGEGKADRLEEVLREVRGDRAPALPAARVRPGSGHLRFLVDRAAARQIPEGRVSS